MKKVLYIHGKGGSAAEAEHYRPLFAGHEVIGIDYRAQTPWEAKEEFPRLFDSVAARGDSVLVVANSIGAYFTMSALAEKAIERALFVSPIVDMETLISDMMRWANVSEETLRDRKVIPTAFGESLSWDYLSYVRAHPLAWKIPTHILYGANDSMTSRDTVTAFAAQMGAPLTVMENGEHWFHTEEQLRFLDAWVRKSV